MRVTNNHLSGFTLSYRSKWYHDAFRSLQEAAIWSWLCDVAVWEEEGRDVPFNGVTIHLQRRQVVTSSRFVCDKKGFGITERAWRTFLTRLKKANMIEVDSNPRRTIITILNYDKFQSGVLKKRRTGDEPDAKSDEPDVELDFAISDEEITKKVFSIGMDDEQNDEQNKKSDGEVTQKEIIKKPNKLSITVEGRACSLSDFYFQLQGIINSPIPIRMDRVQGWIERGASPDLILTAIREVMDKRNQKGNQQAITTIKYFEPAVKEAVIEERQFKQDMEKFENDTSSDHQKPSGGLPATPDGLSRRRNTSGRGNKRNRFDDVEAGLAEASSDYFGNLED